MGQNLGRHGRRMESGLTTIKRTSCCLNPWLFKQQWELIEQIFHVTFWVNEAFMHGECPERSLVIIMALVLSVVAQAITVGNEVIRDGWGWLESSEISPTGLYLGKHLTIWSWPFKIFFLKTNNPQSLVLLGEVSVLRSGSRWLRGKVTDILWSSCWCFVVWRV